VSYISTPHAVERRIRFAITNLESALRNLERPYFDPDQRNEMVCDIVRDFAIAINSLGEASEKLTRWGFTR